jgi:hypothetical protein
LGDGKADAVLAARALIKALENMRQVRIQYAGAVICDGGEDPRPLPPLLLPKRRGRGTAPE